MSEKVLCDYLLKFAEELTKRAKAYKRKSEKQINPLLKEYYLSVGYALAEVSECLVKAMKLLEDE